MSIYENWGFYGSPFSHKPLEADRDGLNLLVGREKEKRKILIRLQDTDKICTVEGNIGIGKTSLVNVTTYESFKKFTDGKSNKLLIPCIDIFQLNSNDNLETFRKNVLIKIAETIIKYSDILNNSKNISKIGKFFEPEKISQLSAGISILGCGVNGGRTKDLNGSKVFEENGFFSFVEKILEEIFITNELMPENSGIVCVIDNLEMVRTHERAKELLEEMRDTVLSIAGTKWVLCGENNIFRSVVSSQRLEGYIHEPITLGALSISKIPTMYERRIEFYSESFDDIYLPFTVEEFLSLFRILNGNTRAIFDKIDKYCLWVYEEGERPKKEIDKEEMFAKWLDESAEAHAKEILEISKYQFLNTFYHLCMHENEFDENVFHKEKYSDDMCFKNFMKNMESMDLMKIDDDGEIWWLPKGSFVKYYFGTFGDFNELEDEIYDRFGMKLKETY